MSIQDLTQLSDADLIRFAQHEEPNAFYVLHERKDSIVIKLIRKVVHYDPDKAEEADQATWVDIFTRFHSKPEETIKDFDALLRTIGFHKAIDTLRRGHTVPADETINWIKDSEPDEINQLIIKENLDKVNHEIKHMPPWRRKLILLWMRGYSAAQIEEMEGLAANTASSEISKALKYLIAKLTGNGRA